MIAFESRLAMMFGRMAKNSAQQIAAQRPMYIFLLRAGPMSWLNIFRGFMDSSTLPSGFGSVGEWFGLSLALPTGFF